MEPYMIAVIAVAVVAVIFFIGIAVSNNARKNIRSRLNPKARRENNSKIDIQEFYVNEDKGPIFR